MPHGSALSAGDILDGYHPKDKSIAALEELLEIFDALQGPHWHMIGNHCLYNLRREASPPSPITMTMHTHIMSHPEMMLL